MRFMIMIKADKNTEAGVLPGEKLLTDMGKYNEELVKAGVMLAQRAVSHSSGSRFMTRSTRRRAPLAVRRLAAVFKRARYVSTGLAGEGASGPTGALPCDDTMASVAIPAAADGSEPSSLTESIGSVPMPYG